MALATVSNEDVEAALGRSLTPTESSWCGNLLDAASDLVVGYLGRTPDPVPGGVARVVADMVAAVFSKPSITTADYSASGYNQSREAAGVHVGVEAATTTGPWLTKALKMRLRPVKRGAFSINTFVETDCGS